MVRPSSYLRAARVCGIPIEGWAPRCWLTEAGPVPWLAEWGLAECPEGRPRQSAIIDVARFGLIDRRSLESIDFGLVGG
jgi:hypothetical protein